MTSPASFCLCLIGWHYSSLIYEQLQDIKNIDVVIISHRPKSEIPEKIVNSHIYQNLIVMNNVGYDWGAYQQFLNLNLHADYPYLFFAHDDIEITNSDVFSMCIEKFNENQSGCIIGNGRQTFKRDWPKTHIQSYAHSSWKPPGWDFEHDTVRGSFWATSRQVLQRLNPLEVLWDRRKLIGVGAGNWSLRATCGKAQHLLGDQAFLFLSDTYLKSTYIIEYERGHQKFIKQQPPLTWRLTNIALVWISKNLMNIYMNSKSKSIKQSSLRVMEGLFQVI